MSGKHVLEKHQKYKSKYGKDELYWGIGIENEMYLTCSHKAEVSLDFFRKNHKPERYSVDYYKSYKEKCLQKAIDDYTHKQRLLTLPLLINAHSFTHVDQNGEHKTTFEKQPKPNPNFNGKTVHEILLETSPYFAEHYERDIVYDGDTIEFITQDFYNANVKDVVEELKNIKKGFTENVIPKIPITDFGKISLMDTNHPFAVHLTNMKNVSMFNNGTYHFNFTLPTLLDNNGNIKNMRSFINDHQNAIRLLQLMEPIFITVYGTPDPFHTNSHAFSSASQRCAVSRYIGVSTYDTEEMKKGKQLHVSSKDCVWYNEYHSQSAYKKLDEIGLDINFNKHHHHGIELRIFEYFNDELLEDLLECIIYIFDHSLEYNYIDNIINRREWNEMMINCMRCGKNAFLPQSQMYLFNQVFGFSYRPMNILDFYERFQKDLKDKYKNSGKCSAYMIRNEKKVEKTNEKTNEKKTEKTNETKNEKKNETFELKLTMNPLFNVSSDIIDNVNIDNVNINNVNIDNVNIDNVKFDNEIPTCLDFFMSINKMSTEVQNKIDQKVDEAQQKLDQKVDDIQNKVDQKVDGIQNKVDQKVDDAQKKVDQKVDDIQNKVDQKVDDAQHKVNQKVDDIQNKVNQKVDEAQNKINQKVDEIQNKINEKVDEAQQKVDQKVDEIQNKINEKVDEIQNKVNQKVDEAQQKVNQKVDEIQHDAQQKVDEIQNKINEKVDEAQQKANEAIEKITSCCIIA